MSDLKKIEFVIDGTTEHIYCSMVGENLYRCEESSLLNESIIYGTEIEVKKDGDFLKFIKIITESPFFISRFLLAKELLDSDKGKKAKDMIIECGGTWEQIMDGIFLFYLPKHMKRKAVEVRNILKS
jgi:hypothetical protein